MAHPGFPQGGGQLLVGGGRGIPYQKMKTYRLRPTIYFLKGPKITSKKKCSVLGGRIPGLRGANSSLRAPKGLRGLTPDLNGSLKVNGMKSVLNFRNEPLLALKAALGRVPGL